MAAARNIKKYLIFSKATVLDIFAYRVNIWIWTIVTVLELFLVCALWSAVFKYSGESVINGFTLNMMIFYMAMTKVTANAEYSSNSFYAFSADIRSGNIAISLVRPISYKAQSFFGCIGGFVAFSLIVSIPVFVVTFAIITPVFGIPLPSALTVLLYVVSLFLGTLINDGIGFMLGSVAFYTGALYGLSTTKSALISFLSGMYIPLVFFPKIVQTLLNFSPFPYVFSVPNLIITGHIDAVSALFSIVIQLFWAILLYLLGVLVYNRVKARLVSNGG